MKVTTQRTSKPIKLIGAIGFLGTAIAAVAWMAGSSWAIPVLIISVLLWMGGRMAAWWFHE